MFSNFTKMNGITNLPQFYQDIMRSPFAAAAAAAHFASVSQHQQQQQQHQSSSQQSNLASSQATSAAAAGVSHQMIQNGQKQLVNQMMQQQFNFI